MSKCEQCIFDLNKDIRKHYKKNDVIFLEGDDIHYIFRIKQGIVKLEKLNENGEVMIIDLVKEGDYLALLSVIKDMKEYLVTATCITEVEVTPIPFNDAKQAYLDNLHFKDTCMRCAAHRLGIFQDHTFMKGNVPPEDKIMNTLRYLSSKFGTYKNKQLYIDLPISKSEFANMVGLRRETLSRKLSTMQEEGILEISKNVYKIL